MYLIRHHVIYVVRVRKMLKLYINVRNASQETIIPKHVRLNNIRNTRNIVQLFQN